MVVQFSLDVPPVADERHPVKKKYLVSRTREQKNSIFDYVNLSSSLLRKVRYGQSLDAALQTRSPWTSAASPGGFRPLRESSPSLASFWRGSEAISSPIRRNPPPSVNQRSEKIRTSDTTIRFGRQIQLQATDGGFLAVDADGHLIKLPRSHRGDSSTLLTLFPHDPLRAPGSKSQVCTDERCFVVLGAATVQSEHKVVYADAQWTYEPPAALRDAVLRHHRQHRGGHQHDLTNPRGSREVPQSTVWSLRVTTARIGARDVLKHGMLVQLKQRDLTMHYETERVVKKKYKPITSIGPEADDTPSPADKSPLDSEQHQSGGAQTNGFTHVWLQHNDVSSQHETRATQVAALKPWDNLWFIIDVATEQKRDRQRKQKHAMLVAEREAELRTSDDSDERCERDQSRLSEPSAGVENSILPIIEEPSSDNNHDEDEEDSTRNAKRLSVMHARAFVSEAAEESQRHAAAIIVRFMRRVFRREAERRAKDLIDRRIRRTGKSHRHGEVDDCTLSTMQQLRILQCFKPNVYGSQRTVEPMSRRIPGISFQGSKYPQQEAHRLASMHRDLTHLGSEDFQPQQMVVRRSLPRSRTEEPQLGATLRAKQQQLSKERDRDRKLHVQLAMAHREKPPFRFGKLDLRLQVHHRPQTALGSPSPKPAS